MPAFGQPEGLLGEEVGAAGDQTPGPCRGREGGAHALRQVKRLPRWEPRTADLAQGPECMPAPQGTQPAGPTTALGGRAAISPLTEV